MVPVFDWSFSSIIANAIPQKEDQQLYFKDRWETHSDLSTPEVAKARWQFFDIPGTTPADYTEQIIQFTLPHFPPITGWAGIRFRNLDARTPFVSVFLTLNPQTLLQPLPLRMLQQKLQAYFAVFAPHGFTLRIPVSMEQIESLQNTPEQAPTEIPHQIWNTYWFKDLTSPEQPLKQSQAALTSLPNIQLIPLKNLEDPHFDYERFYAQHQLWRLLHKNLAPWIQPASAEELAESCAQKLCYLAYTSDHEPIGIVAGQPDNYYGVPGVSVLELFIYSTYQGKGYGKAMQSLFQQQLKAQGHRAMWGSIYSGNTASWRTARACGRQMVEQECFFPFHDLEA